MFFYNCYHWEKCKNEKHLQLFFEIYDLQIIGLQLMIE